MRRLSFLSLAFSLLLLLPGCQRSSSESYPDSLGWGDAEWPEAPIPQPGGGGMGGDGGGLDDEGGADDWGSGGFVPDEDFGAVSECDPFLQDCPEGEKCVAYASTGGNFDANKCVPVMGSQAAGQSCLYGGAVEATDDCNVSSYCWDVMDVMGSLEGSCAAFCQGTADNPICDPGLECLIAYDGSVNLCVEPGGDGDGDTTGDGDGDATGDGDGDGDGDTTGDGDGDGDTGTETGMADMQGEELMCPDTEDPIVLYMSNDDSNSQASPALVRRLIHDGLIVDPNTVRIHEFLNYYDLHTTHPTNKPAAVGMQMRRTNEETGEFTLLAYASGQQVRPEERPPLNLVFSLDTSGSMSGEPIELLKDSVTALAGQLRAGDNISLVQWDTAQGIVLQNHPVSGPNDPSLMAAIESLEAGGGTDLHAGLVTAYDLAEQGYIAGGINRVVLISDGGANAGVTDTDLIAAAAEGEDGAGIYLVGVGVGDAAGYSDALMDQVTDAGKGAYLFIDNPYEAEHQFGENFVSNISVAARNVQMELTLPWYFGVKSFHGEEYSEDPAEVEPQHLAPNDAMGFHQIIGACDPDSINPNDTVKARVNYLHPLTLQPMSDELELKIGTLVKANADLLYKADVIVNFAKAIIVIGYRRDTLDYEGALEVAVDMAEWLDQAASTLNDPEVQDMADLMDEYVMLLM